MIKKKKTFSIVLLSRRLINGPCDIKNDDRKKNNGLFVYFS